MSRLPLPVALLLACALILSACGDKEKEKTASAPAATETAEPAQEAGCEKVAKPQPANEAKLPKPTSELKAGKTYVARVLTNCGEFEITLDPKRAPKTGGSFASLVSKRFYDGLTFHRIVPGFVIQGGDPTGDGSGGPGYSTVDPPPADTRYTSGVVAMAKTQDEPAGTAGSQFFVVTGADAGLPADYAVAGKVTRGLDVVKRIGKLGDQSEQPTTTVEIQSLRVTSQ